MAKRVAFVMEVKPGYEEEYARRHQAVFPGVLDCLKRVGISNYSIYQDGNRLFAYLECETDFATAMEQMSKDPEVQRWWAYMEPLMAYDASGKPATRELREVFHLD